jgi:DNA-binding SARP family transcriptional activator
MTTVGWVLRVIVSAVLVAVIGLLIASRPALPAAAAFSSARRVDGVLVLIAWLGCLLLAVGLLYRFAKRKRHPLPPFASSIRNLHPTPRARPVAAIPYPDRAFPLIPRSQSTPQREQCGEHDPSDEVAAPETEPALATKKTDRQRARIEILGPLTITGTRKRGRGLRGPTRDLLAYLAFHPNGAHRDQIIDALWPDQVPEQGRNRLWRAVADVRHHLGDTVLTRENEHYQLERAQVTVDLDELENLLLELGDREGENALPVLEEALELFGGEPLAGADLPWAENEQRRLHAIQLDLLARAGEAHLAASDPTQALAYAEHGLVQEPYNEKLVRLAMSAEAALGLRSAIVSRYERLCEILDEQLGLQPHRETKVLYRSLLGQDVRIGA